MFLSSLACCNARSDVTTGLKRKQQDQRDVLVVVKPAIAGIVPLAPDLVQLREQRQQLVEILQARDILLTDVFTLLAGHAAHYARYWRGAQVELFYPPYLAATAQIPCRTALGLSPLFPRLLYFFNVAR